MVIKAITKIIKIIEWIKSVSAIVLAVLVCFCRLVVKVWHENVYLDNWPRV